MREPQAAIPRFFLYGEPPRDAGERFLHVETIADRCRVNDWRIQPHAHRDLHQLLVIFAGVARWRLKRAGTRFVRRLC